MVGLQTMPAAAAEEPPRQTCNSVSGESWAEDLEARTCVATGPEAPSKPQHVCGGSTGLLPTLSAQQRRLRLKTTLAAMSLDAIPGLYVGSSTWVDFMNKTVPPGMSSWLAPGVTQPAVFIVTGLCIYFPLLAYLLRRKKMAVQTLGVLAMLGVAFPLSIAVTAGGGGFWVQYFGAALGGVGLVAAQFVEKIVAIQWWALTGESATGAAWMGGSVGVWSLAFTLGSAWLCHGLGLEYAMYILAVIIFLATLFPLWLAYTGELQAPLPETMCASANSASVSGHGQGKAVERSAFAMRSLLCSLTFWQLAFHFMAFFFFGFGMKQLLSPIFQATYGVTYLESAYLAAVVLAIYAAVRSGLPLLTRRLPLTPVCAGLMAFSAILYACFPAIVRHLPVWWLLLAKTLTGASFAGASTLRNLLALELYGAAGLADVLPLLEVGVGVGKFVGPMAGYFIYLADTDDGIGGGDHSSYNPFFYACAVVAAADAGNLLALHLRARRQF